MKSLWVIAFYILIKPFNSTAQINHEGIPFYDFYPINAYGLPQETWCITEDYRGVIYVASNNGLLEFDGSKWNTYYTDNNSGVRTVTAQPSGRIYAGAVQTFGYFEPNEGGVLEFYSLCPLLDTKDLDFSDVWQVKECNSYIYFHTMLKLFRYNPKDHTILTIEAKTDFQLMGNVKNELYIGHGSIGLCKVVADSLVLIRGGEYFKDKIIYNILPYDTDNILVSDKFNIYIFNIAKGSLNQELTQEFTKQFPIIDERFYVIFKVRGDKFGISTLNKGVYILNKDGSVQKHFSLDNILPSNVSFYGIESRNGNLWLGLDNGVLKVENGSPFSKLDYNMKNPLSINAIAHFNNKLYYTSNLGLFSKTINDRNSWKIDYSTHIVDLNFRCFQFSFIQSINSKNDSALLVPSEEGLFVVRDNTAKPISNKIVFLNSLQSKYEPSTIYVSSNKGLAYLKYPSSKFSDLQYIPQVKSVVSKIIEDKRDRLWVSTSTDGFYYLQREKDKFKVLYHFQQQGEISNIDFAYLRGKEVLFIYRNKLWSFNLETYHVKESKHLLPKVLQDKDIGWLEYYKDTTLWYFIFDENFFIPCQTIGNSYPSYNSVFKRIINQGLNTVYQESDSKVWFGSSKGVICAQNFAECNLHKQKPLVYIRSIAVNRDSIIYEGSGISGGYGFTLKENIGTIKQGLPNAENKIGISVSSPFLISEASNQYSFYLKNYEKTWTEWSTSNKSEFKNLPSGSYTLYVKSRNVFGIESNTLEISFSVLSPWYATIYSIMAGLIFSTMVIYLVIIRVQKSHRDERLKLENIINQRTSEIINQKTKIETQLRLLDISNKSIQQLSVVAQETDNPVIITNINGQIEWVNRSFYRYYDLHNVESLKFSDIINNVDIDEKIRNCIDQKTPISFSGQFDTKLKHKIWFQITINPITDDWNDVINIIIVCSDITDIIELNKTRDLIISVITHDLKSPLLGFKMMAKSLSDNIDNIEREKLHEWVQSMHDNSSDIYELVENLTKWFKSQRGMISYTPTFLDLHKTVNEVFTIFEPQATTKGIRLANFVKEGIKVYADINMIQTIFRNLLSNAIKFSEMGLVCITSEIKDQEVIISVSDEGVGFDNQTKTKILSNDYTEGIGLLICKEFIQKNGGRLLIDSNSEGSVISFTIPNNIE